MVRRKNKGAQSGLGMLERGEACNLSEMAKEAFILAKT